jgi:prefoldin subunit 5
MKAAAFPIASTLLITFIFITACDRHAAWDAQGNALISQAASLEQQHMLLNTRIDSLWDATTIALAAALPSDFPPTDRGIFLKARNADHIRMFMSFNTLSPETQALVNNAGKQDEMLAGQMRQLQQKQEAFEQEKIEFLRKVAETDTSAYTRYADLLHHAVTGHIEK